MLLYADDPKLLWERYLETRSSECQIALLQHYAPAVLMQTCSWTTTDPTEESGTPSASTPATDRMAVSPDGQPFIPYVPPGPWQRP